MTFQCKPLPRCSYTNCVCGTSHVKPNNRIDFGSGSTTFWTQPQHLSSNTSFRLFSQKCWQKLDFKIHWCNISVSKNITFLFNVQDSCSSLQSSPSNSNIISLPTKTFLFSLIKIARTLKAERVSAQICRVPETFKFFSKRITIFTFNSNQNFYQKPTLNFYTFYT